MATKAKKPTLSPTKLSTFLACPTKYYWTYLDERGRYYLRAKSYYSFGTSLHAVLQRFHDRRDTGVQTVSEAVAALEEGWIESGYESPQEMAEALGEGKDLVVSYIEDFVAQEHRGVTLYIEKMLRYDLGPFILIGRVDRVDEYPDGSLDIVDYKSGRSSVASEDIRDDLAMACYQLLVKRLHPDRSVRATIVALRARSAASFAMSDGEMSEFEVALRELGETVLNRDYTDHVPTEKDLCGQCDFIRLCQQNGLMLTAPLEPLES